MEPTGIEPVTSCLQSDCADPLQSPISRQLMGILANSHDVDMAGLGAIRLGLGSGTGLLPKRGFASISGDGGRARQVAGPELATRCPRRPRL
jgi:hypothetical protein